MTIYELYDSTIKILPVNDRLRLARLILDDAATDEPTTAIESEAYLARLIQEGIESGLATAWTDSDVDHIKQIVTTSSAKHNV